LAAPEEPVAVAAVVVAVAAEQVQQAAPAEAVEAAALSSSMPTPSARSAIWLQSTTRTGAISSAPLLGSI
jgi:hypothetical protein